jgi:hypothetical protein
MEDKKLIVFNEIKNHSAFIGEGHKLSIAGIAAKFNRMEQNVIAKYALDGEGANLSGLPENPSRCESLLYKMVKEKREAMVTSSNKRKKDNDRAERLQNYTNQMVQSMVRPPAVESSVVEPAGGHLRTTTTTQQQQRSPSTRNNDIEPSSVSSKESGNTSDRWAELMVRREERQEQKRQEDRSVQEKLLSMEERRLQLEEQRVKIDAQRVENERKLYDILMVQTVNANNNNTK